MRFHKTITYRALHVDLVLTIHSRAMFSLRNVITIVTVFTRVMLPCSEASISGQGPRMALNADVDPDTVMDNLDTVVDDLDIFVNTVMACRDIAGLNLVVVAKGNVLLSKGKLSQVSKILHN